MDNNYMHHVITRYIYRKKITIKHNHYLVRAIQQIDTTWEYLRVLSVVFELNLL